MERSDTRRWTLLRGRTFAVLPWEKEETYLTADGYGFTQMKHGQGEESNLSHRVRRMSFVRPSGLERFWEVTP